MATAASKLTERYAEYLTRQPAEVAADLEGYAALLTKWQNVQNLVSRETLGELWSRHIADSLQVLKLVTEDDLTFVDLGSGGGLPAIPAAIGRRGKGSFQLIESNNRKVSFLRAAGRELDLAIEVLPRRIEEIDSRETSRPDVITARALAPLRQLFRLSAPLFGAETRAIFHKGREYENELAESRALWRFDVLVHPSDTNPEGVLLEVRNLRAKAEI